MEVAAPTPDPRAVHHEPPQMAEHWSCGGLPGPTPLAAALASPSIALTHQDAETNWRGSTGTFTYQSLPV